MACCLGKAQVMHERNIQNWAAHVFNGPERDQEGKQETNHKNTMHRYRHEKSAALCSVMAPHRRVALNRVLRNVKDGGGRCIALRRWRQQVRERERERGGNKGIDSSPSYPYCLWAHVGWTCWTPTERPAVTEKNRGKPWWGIFRQTGTDSLLFIHSACFCLRCEHV